jgi:hypothetical protein
MDGGGHAVSVAGWRCNCRPGFGRRAHRFG